MQTVFEDIYYLKGVKPPPLSFMFFGSYQHEVWSPFLSGSSTLALAMLLVCALEQHSILMLQVERASHRVLYGLPGISSAQVLPLPSMAMKAAMRMRASRDLISKVRCIGAFDAFSAIRD